MGGVSFPTPGLATPTTYQWAMDHEHLRSHVQTCVVVTGLRLPGVMTPTDDLVAAVGCRGVEFLPAVMATGGVDMAGMGRFFLLMTGREVGGWEGVMVDACTFEVAGIVREVGVVFP